MLNRRVRPWLLPPLPNETVAQTNDRRDQAYFAEQIAENDEWLRRMSRGLTFTGKRVLDLGCGHGALSIFMAQCGAAKVVGVDLDSARINFARANLRDRYPQFADVVSFKTIDIAELSGEFDMVVSKDTFEHIEDLGAVLRHIFRLLVPGGALASGFGPLYYSPFGDHGRFHLGVPWLHALLPNAVLAAGASRREGFPVRRAMDLGLNQLTSAKLEYLITQQPWSAVDIRLNQGSKRLFKLFNMLRRFPPTEKYFTVNAYLIAWKGRDQADI